MVGFGTLYDRHTALYLHFLQQMQTKINQSLFFAGCGGGLHDQTGGVHGRRYSRLQGYVQRIP